MPLYADIVLPLAQPAYTFAVPEGMHVEAGQAVAVQFGARKFYTGIVWRVHDRRPPFKTVKSIQRVLYGAPLLSAQQMAFWEWVAAYYMCTPGEVMRVGLPSLMKPSGDTEEEFTEEEFRPRTECYVALAPGLHDEGRLHEAFEKLERRAPRQYEALLELASAGDGERIPTGEVARRLLRADYAVLHALERKGYIVSAERERTVERGGSAFRLPELTPAQLAALESLRGQFARKPAALLHGITGSGKTEVYIHLIAEVLARGGDVLLLVPEIALTAQLIERMERIFGSRVTPYHSKLTNRRRTETYLRLNRSQGGEFVVGVRSSIFLPLNRLQLVVVDEEHDASYKQADPAPRYNARDCAVVMARLWGGRTLLGSATPSLETWVNAGSGKYGLASLTERYGDARPPEIFVSDTIRAAKRGERHAHFNKLLLDKMEAALGRGEQVMLFQNRRGFAPYVECSECGWTARCPHCNVTLTYHKGGGKLVCHYCGYETPQVHACPSCGSPYIGGFRAGTQQIEQKVKKLFPKARVLRMDGDTTKTKNSYEEILSAFAAGEADILIGTQMIVKGHDFPNVTLVGALAAYLSLNAVDYRAGERTFQLLTQAVGRAGRGEKPGMAVIQTYHPEHYSIQTAAEQDYGTFYEKEMDYRRLMGYPPAAELLAIHGAGEDEAHLTQAMEYIRRYLIRIRGNREVQIIGPASEAVSKINDLYRMAVYVRAPQEEVLAELREKLERYIEINKGFRTVYLQFDFSRKY